MLTCPRCNRWAHILVWCKGCEERVCGYCAVPHSGYCKKCLGEKMKLPTVEFVDKNGWRKFGFITHITSDNYVHYARYIEGETEDFKEDDSIHEIAHNQIILLDTNGQQISIDELKKILGKIKNEQFKMV